MAKIAFIDLETTGFSREWNEIIEVAAILYDEDTREEIDRYHEYIKPNKPIPYKITDITGITNQQVAGCRSEIEVLMDFYEWLMMSGATKACGHNYKAFDKSFLVAKANKYNIKFPDDLEDIDTLALARALKKAGKISTPNLQQPTIAKFYGIEYKAHSAIEDVKALIQIYEKMGLNKTNSAKRAELGF